MKKLNFGKISPMANVIYIKNMVCPRCVKVVKDTLYGLGIEFDDVVLGQATLKEELTPELEDRLKSELLREGFEILDDSASMKVEKIRLAIIAWARMEGERPVLSDYLQSHCLQEYSSVSKLFSQMRSITVERYAILQRLEYAKELISYGDRSLSEISWILGFSSPSHFSSHFKKETGLTPKQFKELHAGKREFIDNL